MDSAKWTFARARRPPERLQCAHEPLPGEQGAMFETIAYAVAIWLLLDLLFVWWLTNAWE